MGRGDRRALGEAESTLALRFQRRVYPGWKGVSQREFGQNSKVLGPDWIDVGHEEKEGGFKWQLYEWAWRINQWAEGQ